MIFFSKVFGGFFLTKFFLGGVLADLALRVALSNRKNKCDSSQYKLESSPEYIALTTLEFAMIAVSAIIPLKFLMRKKLWETKPRERNKYNHFLYASSGRCTWNDDECDLFLYV